jgi:hypothetical protein
MFIKLPHGSFEEFGTKNLNKILMKKKKQDKTKEDLPGYPDYPDSQDIFKSGIKEDKIDPEDITSDKAPNMKADEPNEKSFEDDVSGDDLDVPGSELDDKEEAIGSEDEENNYYSLGGGDHNDLEEDKGN